MADLEEGPGRPGPGRFILDKKKKKKKKRIREGRKAGRAVDEKPAFPPLA